MFLIKITVTILVVTLLSIVAERVSPRAAGIVSGFPLGTAISLFFIGLEQGTSYAGAGAVYAAAGMAPLFSFFYIYYLVSKRMRRHSILAASGAAIAVLLAIDFLLQLFTIPAWAGFLIAAASILGFRELFRHIPNTQIIERLRLGPRVLLLRAALAALVILAITAAAKIVPSDWAGLFSAFPSTVFPLILIIHSAYGSQQAHTIIKNLPTGMWGLVLYCLTISFTYPSMGVYWGTLTGYAVATIYLLGLAAFQWRLTRMANRDIIKLRP